MTVFRIPELSGSRLFIQAIKHVTDLYHDIALLTSARLYDGLESITLIISPPRTVAIPMHVTMRDKVRLKL
jgi:hypothetical protein